MTRGQTKHSLHGPCVAQLQSLISPQTKSHNRQTSECTAALQSAPLNQKKKKWQSSQNHKVRSAPAPELHMATPKRTPTPVSTKKATAPSPTSPHMYERKQSCIKLGDLLPSGQLTPVSHFMQFSGHLCFKKKEEKKLTFGAHQPTKSHQKQQQPVKIHCHIRYRKNQSMATATIIVRNSIKKVATRVCNHIKVMRHDK